MITVPVAVATFGALLITGAALFLRRPRPWFSNLLSGQVGAGKVMSSAFSGRDEPQVWSRFGHLCKFGLVIALILLLFVEFPVRSKSR